MKRTEYIIEWIDMSGKGLRRVYEDEYGDMFVKLKGQIISIHDPRFAWSQLEYYPHKI